MTEKTTIADFMAKLGSVELDCFVRVMGRLEAKGSANQIAQLETRLAEIKQRITEINKRRDSLRIQKEDLTATLNGLDAIINGSEPEPDLIQMRLVLLELDARLDERIATSRPVELLDRKVELRKEIASRKLLARLGNVIGTAARNRGKS